MIRSLFSSRAWCCAALLVLCSAAGVRAEAPSALRVVAHGLSSIAGDGLTPAELIRFDPGLVARLLSVPVGRRIRLEGWPTLPGEREDVDFSRVDVYHPEARIWRVDGQRTQEVPRSRLRFFSGTIATRPADRLLLWVDPESRALAGVLSRPQGVHELRTLDTAAETYVLAASSSFAPSGSDRPTWSCGEESTTLDSMFAAASTPLSIASQAITSLHTAVVAVDTDMELMHLKFANSTSAAADYLATLFASMNIMYERDLQVRLLQGDTFLRPSPAANPTNYSGDPYTRSCLQVINGQTYCGANGGQLDEFSAYWAGGCGGACGGVQRALTMMISGKQTTNNSASGIAWLNGLCSSTIGYSFTQVFKFAGSNAVHDSRMVGHENGHNFGSSHTHCYSPPVDVCYNGQGGCYTGATGCPAPASYNGVTNVRGTVMSYCHLLGGCGASEVFHPATVSLLAPIIGSRVGQCIFPASFFADGFESGALPGAWGGKTP